MKHDWTVDLLTYWDRLRGTRAAPDRRDISPRELGSKLPHIFILRGDLESSESATVPSAKQWQFRLAGTRLCTIYGRELRNTRFLSLWHEDVRPWLAEQLHLSGLDYRPLRLEHTGITVSEKNCHFETLLLPLHETDGSPAWIGSMIALNPPLWLGSDPLISNHMGLIAEKLAYQPEPVEQILAPHANSPHPSGPHASGMKSVLQVLLDRHHELATNTTPMPSPAAQPAQAAKSAENSNHQLADSAFARAILPQIEALMPATMVADAIATETPNPQADQYAPHHSAGSGSYASSSPLTVADIIKSIHPAVPQTDPVATPKPFHLKLIPGGKDKT